MKLLFRNENIESDTNEEVEYKQIIPKRGWQYQQERFIKQAREEANRVQDDVDG